MIMECLCAKCREVNPREETAKRKVQSKDHRMSNSINGGFAGKQKVKG